MIAEEERYSLFWQTINDEEKRREVLASEKSKSF
jgi:hypothetical protein